jgi:hypothetical protein
MATIAKPAIRDAILVTGTPAVLEQVVFVPH